MGCNTSKACDSPKKVEDEHKKIIRIHEENKYVAELLGVQEHHFWKHGDQDLGGGQLESSASTWVASDEHMEDDTDPLECTRRGDVDDVNASRVFAESGSYGIKEIKMAFSTRCSTKPEEGECQWHRFARKQLSRKHFQLDMVNSRLERDGVCHAELNKNASRAVENYAHFHGMEAGSTDVAACPCGTERATICSVILSSAGFQGWTTAKVGLGHGNDDTCIRNTGAWARRNYGHHCCRQHDHC
jgi:hypothetical protein